MSEKEVIDRSQSLGELSGEKYTGDSLKFGQITCLLSEWLSSLSEPILHQWLSFHADKS
jgi:hypothetical protein